MNKIDDHVIYSPRLSERVYDRSIFVAGKFNWAKGRELPKSVSVWIDQVCVGKTQVFAEKNFPEGHLDTKSLGKCLSQSMSCARRYCHTALYRSRKSGRKIG